MIGPSVKTKLKATNGLGKHYGYDTAVGGICEPTERQHKPSKLESPREQQPLPHASTRYLDAVTNKTRVIATTQRFTGTVRWFDPVGGYGYIYCNALHKRAYVCS